MRLIAFATLITLAVCHPNDRDRRQLPFGGGGGRGGGGGFGQLFNAPQNVLNTASKTATLGGAAFKIPGISDFTNTALDLSSIPAGDTDALFDGFQSQLKRTYATAEETLLRKNIFKGTNDFVQGFNSAVAGFTVGLNWLADLTLEEFNKLLNGYGKSKSGGDKFKSKAKPFDLPTSPQALPKSVDWRKEGAVTPIKNQQQCASCFAFSAIGAVEGHYFRKTGELLELSQQNLIDCTQDDEYQNLGCSGGFVDASFEYVKKNLGVNKYSDYPYESESGACRFVKEKASANVTGFGTIPGGDEKALAAAVAKKGPVSVAIYASLLSFKQYKDGVYFDKECKNTSDDVNHAVLVVGYGEEDGKKYWIVKNSYGPDWGDKGYIKIAKDKGNHCGIATAAFYPVV